MAMTWRREETEWWKETKLEHRYSDNWEKN